MEVGGTAKADFRFPGRWTGCSTENRWVYG